MKIAINVVNLAKDIVNIVVQYYDLFNLIISS